MLWACVMAEETANGDEGVCRSNDRRRVWPCRSGTAKGLFSQISRDDCCGIETMRMMAVKDDSYCKVEGEGVAVRDSPTRYCRQGVGRRSHLPRSQGGLRNTTNLSTQSRQAKLIGPPTKPPIAIARPECERVPQSQQLARALSAAETCASPAPLPLSCFPQRNSGLTAQSSRGSESAGAPVAAPTTTSTSRVRCDNNDNDNDNDNDIVNPPATPLPRKWVANTCPRCLRFEHRVQRAAKAQERCASPVSRHCSLATTRI
ncbi:hypothetical protein BCR34DRAFT_40353 [Clohesyomyces aquaticus]|uniref:Uncharacterized protein n=1 Tax=Clohesyomyces aquaticus TaxID=1231657 RepID=A0A1Y2A4R4_9PLEO|nr:hypothetical protein BCR34DRAFT_40353 [Clohesyomyces aquaticus]